MMIAGAAAGADWVWWEGEAAVKTNFPGHTSFSADTFQGKRAVLSGGDWLTNEGKRTGAEAYARYRVAVPEAGEYALWARKFWLHGPFKWRFGQDEWRVCGKDVALTDSVDIRTYLCANWVYLGRVTLGAGEQDFELRLLAGPGGDLGACFDAFILSKGVFYPRGRLKPGEKYDRSDTGYFPYEPELDRFGADALLDLRDLNEPMAGTNGYVRNAGGQFVLGDGTPVRFWAMNVSSGNSGADRDSVDYLARKLAKLGINMVRHHSGMFAEGSDPTKIDAKKLDNLHYLVSAMKRQGIYTYLSFYFPLWFNVKPGYGIPGYEKAENKVPFALLFFNPRMQEIHRSWYREMLSKRNPYTGLPLARDPAVAIVEIQNEDSLFFWTFSKANIPSVHWKKLETMYGGWLAKKYGSLGKALRAWGAAKDDGDRAAEGRAGILEAWHMTRGGAHQNPDKLKRMGDQVRFLAGLQREFYERTVKTMKGELGYGGLVSCGNWVTTDDEMLDAVERYTYTAGDVVDRHNGYYGGKHEGEGAGYSVRPGHKYEDRTMTLDPATGGPLQFIKIAGFPNTMSEIGWPNPNRYMAESPFLAAAYGALQGFDGFFWFAAGNNYVCDMEMNKFAATNPAVAGNSPAHALLYRTGLVRQADEVAVQVLDPEELFALHGSGASTAEALDDLRKRDIPAGAEVRQEVDRLDPLSFFVGRVTRSFGKDKSASMVRNITGSIDRQGKLVRSLTGELLWDYGTGLVTINAPAVRGACGFLAKAGRIILGEVTIESGNEFGTVTLVALDGKPLAESGKILVQAGTEERPYGFKVEGGEIKDLGSPPLGVRRIDCKVTLNLPGSAPVHVVALDLNGYQRAEVPVTGGAGKPAVFQLAGDSLYHVITR
jgi:hypothetical protein